MGRRANNPSNSQPDSGYVRIADIASGGVGHVVLALKREGSFERLYAVKRLRAEHRDDEDFRTMFFDEARLAGFVRHSNVVSVLDVGEDKDGPFLVMDYVEGVPLSALVRHAQRTGVEVPLQIALRIVIEAARGLHAAHEVTAPDGTPLRLVHRDVSPQNILVGYDGVTRVTDFGVAKALGRTTQTVTGVLKGKFGYMAPEQLRFLPVDRRADLFALGVVLYELLVGGRLYRSTEEFDGVRRILEEPPPDLGDKREDAPPRLVELVFSMLAKTPELRPANAQEVVRVLEEVLGEVEAIDGRMDVSVYVSEAFAVERELQSSRARLRPEPTSVWTEPDITVEAPKRHRRALLGAAFTVVLLISAAVAWSQFGSSRESDADAALVPMAQTETAPAPPPSAPEVALPQPVPPQAAEPEAAAPIAEAAPVAHRAEPVGERVRSARRRHAAPDDRGASVPQWDWQ